MSEDYGQETTRLCIDGPRAGEWLTMKGEFLNVPKDPAPVVVPFEEDHVPSMTFDIVEYRAERLKFAGESGTLLVWVSGDMDIKRIMRCIRDLRSKGNL